MILPIEKQQIEISSFNFKDIIESYDVSEATKRNHYSGVKDFLDFIDQEGFSDDVYRRYKQYLLNNVSIRSNTKRQKLIYARKFLRQCEKMGFVDQDLTKGVKSLRSPEKHLREGFSEQEIRLIFERIDKERDAERFRLLKTWATLMVYNGLRQFEVVKIKFEDINFRDGVLKIQGKGRDQEEPVQLHPESLKWIRTFIDAEEIRSGYLFRSPRNIESHVTTRFMQKVFDQIFEDIGVNKSKHNRKTIHCFRHYYVTKLCEITSGDLNLVRQLTRHKSIDTIQVYDSRRRLKQNIEGIFNSFQI